MADQKKILLIDFCNFEDYPMGGHLTFAVNMLQCFKNDLVLVGITTDKKDPVGKWFKKNIGGINYDYFAIAKYDKSKTKHLIPDRLSSYMLIRYYKKKILNYDVQNIFIQRADILLAVKKFGFKNICYRFGGLENPLKLSKYWYAKYAKGLFEKHFFSCFGIVNTILAAGDHKAIKEMILRSRNKINGESVIQFPTRINSEIFKPMSKLVVRKALNIPDNATVISTTGRLGWLKGWMFMINCFADFEKQNPNCFFYFIGEGEDFDKIMDYIASKNLQQKVKLVGKKSQEDVTLYLNASDLYLMGSYYEGWSTTLVEALACGVPICTTNFSSAKEIVTQGVTGYVVDDHNVSTFCDTMKQSLALDKKNLPINSQIKKYAVSELKKDLLNSWSLI